MTFLVERLAELRKHLDHLATLRPRVSRSALDADLSLLNDVLFSLLTVCQLQSSGIASSMVSRFWGVAGMPPLMPSTKLKCSGPESTPWSRSSSILAMWLRS